MPQNALTSAAIARARSVTDEHVQAALDELGSMTRKSTPPRKRGPNPTPVPIPEHWSPEQALAVYDFCTALQELVWRRYHDALIDPMLRAQFEADAPRRTEPRTYRLPFDDDPPF